MDPRDGFASALRFLRRRQGLAQEDFGLVSSRTYISQMERGVTSPTIKKITDLAPLLEVHPATLVILAFVMQEDSVAEMNVCLSTIIDEARELIEEFKQKDYGQLRPS